MPEKESKRVRADDQETVDGGRIEYPVTEQSAKEIDSWFKYHSPKGDQSDRYATIRAVAHGFALVIVKSCPPCADRTAALRKLREVVMTANAAIACNE